MTTTTTLREYLKAKAMFYSPEPGGTSISCSDINALEADRLDPCWKPVAAWRDDRMVDSLLATVDNHLKDLPLPDEQSELDRLFQPVVDVDGGHLMWRRNSSEADVRSLIYAGAMPALYRITNYIDLPFTMTPEASPSIGDYTSRVDLSLCLGQGRGVLVELKAASVLNNALPILQRHGFRLHLGSTSNMAVRVIYKMCLYMASNRVHWAALTSHAKWVFFRLHPDPDGNEPYITFSTVEEQANNTQPFCALLGMMIATALQIDVESHVEKTQLSTILEDDVDSDEQHSSETKSDQDRSGTYKRSGVSTRAEKPDTRSAARGALTHAIETPDLLISWSPNIVKDPMVFAFNEIGSTGQKLSSRAGATHIFLQRVLGSGLTAVVYEATPATDQSDKSSNSKSFAVKTIAKGSFRDKEGYMEHFRKELRAYCEIERAKCNGEMPLHVVPCCYGLYDSESMMALLMDYEGKALTDEELRNLSHHDKTQILELIVALHKIGIRHNDLEARNILRTFYGSFRIIDFAMSSFHKCKGVKEVPWYKGSGPQCAELRYIWDQLSAKK